MELKTKMTAAALAALALGGCGSSSGERRLDRDRKGPPSAAAKAVEAAGPAGECWGVNACKGQGACGGVGHECAGQNECKGQGWLTLTKPQCDERGGKFKAA
jgi:hypothetical protein